MTFHTYVMSINTILPHWILDVYRLYTGAQHNMCSQSDYWGLITAYRSQFTLIREPVLGMYSADSLIYHLIISELYLSPLVVTINLHLSLSLSLSLSYSYAKLVKLLMYFFGLFLPLSLILLKHFFNYKDLYKLCNWNNIKWQKCKEYNVAMKT